MDANGIGIGTATDSNKCYKVGDSAWPMRLKPKLCEVRKSWFGLVLRDVGRVWNLAGLDGVSVCFYQGHSENRRNGQRNHHRPWALSDLIGS